MAIVAYRLSALNSATLRHFVLSYTTRDSASYDGSTGFGLRQTERKAGRLEEGVHWRRPLCGSFGPPARLVLPWDAGPADYLLQGRYEVNPLPRR